MATYVDTLLGGGLTPDTARRVAQVMQTVDARRPSRELMAAFAPPAPFFGLEVPNKTVLNFATPLLRSLPIGPVDEGSDEHRRLVKFSPVITLLSRLKEDDDDEEEEEAKNEDEKEGKAVPKQQHQQHTMCLERVEWSMEVYRLTVEVMRCRQKDKRWIDPLTCNRPHLRVPVAWRRPYNKMGIEDIRDLVMINE